MARAALSVFLRPWVRKFQVARSCVDWSAKDCICNNGILYIVQSAQLDAQANSYPHRCTTGRDRWNPRSIDFLMCCSISKRFYLQWKAFDLLYKMRYILWVVALLGACDVTNNGRHLGRHLGFYQELEIRLKPGEMVIFLCLRWKITHK